MSNETSAETTASLSAMKLPELKALAASRGLKGISQLRKHQLIELLSNGAGASTPQETAPREDAPASSKKNADKPAAEKSAEEAPAAEKSASEAPAEPLPSPSRGEPGRR